MSCRASGVFYNVPTAGNTLDLTTSDIMQIDANGFFLKIGTEGIDFSPPLGVVIATVFYPLVLQP